MKINLDFRIFSLNLIWIWLFLFALLPLSLITIVSFMNHSDANLFELPFTLHNYMKLNNYLYLRIFQKSFILAGIVSFLCLLLGYPVAYMIARMQTRLKNLLILLVIIPFWTSSLIRSYALIAMIKTKGLMNTLLLHLGIIHHPIQLLFTDYAVVIGLIYNLLPFMILPLISNIERLDYRLVDAARDLGANRFTTFRKIIIPLTIPGIVAGCILVFLPAMTLFYIPDILGGAKSILLGNLIQNQFFIAQNWPLGAAVSTVLTLVLMLLLLVHFLVNRRNKEEKW
jgi:spermidine/putrescine transport system permease protein